MASNLNILSPDNQLFRVYLFHISILVIKMLTMSLLTSVKRMKHKAFANPEDGASLKIKPRVDDNVERVRRAHLNDLENIPAFFVVSFAYIMTNPSLATATWLFRAFTAARFIHTFVYAICVIPQPARALSFGVGFVITIYMAAQGIINFM